GFRAPSRAQPHAGAAASSLRPIPSPQRQVEVPTVGTICHVPSCVVVAVPNTPTADYVRGDRPRQVARASSNRFTWAALNGAPATPLARSGGHMMSGRRGHSCGPPLVALLVATRCVPLAVV